MFEGGPKSWRLFPGGVVCHDCELLRETIRGPLVELLGCRAMRLLMFSLEQIGLSVDC